MEEYNLDEVINSLDFKRNGLNDCGKGVFLTNFEIDTLKKYNINYKSATSLKEVLFLVEEVLDEDNSLDDLENISNSIAERDYYMNTNK